MRPILILLTALLWTVAAGQSAICLEVESLSMLRDPALQGQTVTLNGKVCTMRYDSPGWETYWIEEENRASAIRVLPVDGVMPSVGDRVQVTGVVGKYLDMPVVLNASFTKQADGAPLKPLGMTNKSAFFSDGAQTDALYVRLWGKVTSVTPGSATMFYMTDGSGDPIRVEALDPGGTLTPVVGTMVVVDGCISKQHEATGYLPNIITLASKVIPAYGTTSVKQFEDFWAVESRKIRVKIYPSTGYIAVLDKQSSYNWRQPGAAPHYAFTNVTPVAEGVSFDTYFDDWLLGHFKARVKLTVPSDGNEMHLSVDYPDHNAAITGFDFIEPFTLDTPDSYIAVADYSDGHIYPTDISAFPIWNLEYYDVNYLDMPLVCVCDLSTGLGYGLIVDTSYDAILQCKKLGTRRAPLIQWRPQLGKFGYERKLIYSFNSNGGYVAAAKAYRSYLKAKGQLVTFTEKKKTTPNVAKLFGAPMIWDYFHYIDAKELKAAGVEKAIHHVGYWADDTGTTLGGGPDTAPAIIRDTNDLGYLTEHYDQYFDAYPYDATHTTPESNYDLYPDHMAKNPDQSVQPGWYGIYGQMYHRCPEFYMPAAQNVIPTQQEIYPLTSRYIDVHTALAAGECYDPGHPKSRTQWIQHNIDLIKYARSLGLVLGGEHGKWWATTDMDVFNGVMSSPGWPWIGRPSYYGQLQYGNQTLQPDAWMKYETWGSLGHAYRVPLWELVFHDCSVAMWYPEDSSDITVSMTGGGEWYQVKKDALNVLYGTPAMLFNVGSDGSWALNRNAFMTSYRTTCKPHEVLADKEMTNHQFLTSDRSLQKTTWSDGTQVVVNFASSNQTVTVGGVSYTLPRFGFVVKGPQITASRSMVNGKQETAISMDGYSFSDIQGVGISMRRVDNSTIRVNIDSGAQTINLCPTDIVPDWNFDRMRVFKCDKYGNRIGSVTWNLINDDQLRIELPEGVAILDLFFYR